MTVPNIKRVLWSFYCILIGEFSCSKYAM